MEMCLLTQKLTIIMNIWVHFCKNKKRSFNNKCCNKTEVI